MITILNLGLLLGEVIEILKYLVRTILEGIISFFPTPSKGALGSLDEPVEERKRLAKLVYFDFIDRVLIMNVLFVGK